MAVLPSQPRHSKHLLCLLDCNIHAIVTQREKKPKTVRQQHHSSISSSGRRHLSGFGIILSSLSLSVGLDGGRTARDE